MTAVLVGALGDARLVRLDGVGGLRPDVAGFVLDWWVGADDRWHGARDEIAVRRSRIGAPPVYETAMRVPGGDAVQRVYGIGGPSSLVVVEIENRSPAPFVQTFVLGGALGRVTIDRTLVRVGRRPVLVLPKPPSMWAVSDRDGGALEAVRSGAASSGPFAGGRRAREVAFLYPVAHRTRLRAALVVGRGPAPAVDLSRVASAEDAARGWSAHLARGMRVVVPDESVQRAVDAARADALLAASGGRHDVELFAALEDWGFDREAAAVWHRLGWGERRHSARRELNIGDSVLRRVRDALVHEAADRSIELVRELEPAWVGQGIEVHDAPTRQGRVSYAVRWHGERPALLWDCERSGVRLRAPGLDATWSTREQRGDALLRPPPRVGAARSE